VDYEFTLDGSDRPVARFSMGFEALGRWFSEELGSNQQLIEELLDIIQQLEQHNINNNHQLSGKDFQLCINQDEVKVSTLKLEGSEDEVLPENTRIYNDELNSGCGLQDFKYVLLSWQEFVTE